MHQSIVLSPLAHKIVRASAGHIVSLPYSDADAMRSARTEAERSGLIVSGYDDDQPTSVITSAGKAYLVSVGYP